MSRSRTSRELQRAGLVLEAKNFLRIVLCDEPERESGQVWRIACETTRSEGGFCGQAVRMWEWKLNQATRRKLSGMYWSNPWAMRPN